MRRVEQLHREKSTEQNAGLEWTWRLGQEPSRMWKRYLVGNTAFVLNDDATFLRQAREAIKSRLARSTAATSPGTRRTPRV